MLVAGKTHTVAPGGALRYGGYDPELEKRLEFEMERWRATMKMEERRRKEDEARMREDLDRDREEFHRKEDMDREEARVREELDLKRTELQRSNQGR